MKTITVEVAKGITKVKKFSDIKSCFDENGKELKAFMCCEYSYTAKIDLLPLKITNINNLEEAKKAINHLNKIRDNISNCEKAWGFGWIGTHPAVVLKLKTGTFVVLHGYEAREKECFISFGEANYFLRKKYCKPDFYRLLTVNKEMSNNKKCYSICDWLLLK